MFTEKVEIKQGKLIITISCVHRQSATDPKRVYNGDINLLIPPDIVNRITLLDSPPKPISNVKKQSLSNVGVWTFEIRPKPSPEKKTRKTSTPTSNRDTIKTE